MRTFYRIVKTDPPTVDDFLSALAKGRRIRRDLPPALRQLWDGVTVYGQPSHAEQKARESPMIGRLIAELRIPDDAPIRWERTTREPGHHTLWGEPEDVLRYVVHVRPVGAKRRNSS